MARFLWICLGGAAGTGARYLVSGWVQGAFGSSYPVGTLAVNLLGSTLLALLMHVGLESSVLSPTLRLALTTGVMGGFTTYSTFSFETMRSLQSGAVGMAALNVAVTVLACLVGCFLGWNGARLWIGS